MTALAPTPSTADTRWPAQRLTVWSLMMLLVYVLWGLALGFFGSIVLLPALDLAEGDLLLMAGGVLGWVAEITMSLLLIAPCLIGLVLGIKAVRRGARTLAWLAVGLNVLPILQVAVAFLDSVHMTYYPQGGWLFW
jgi:hypothetical protein